MLILFERYNMDKIFVALIGVIAFIFACILLKNIFETKKFMRQKIGVLKIAIKGKAYLAADTCAFVKKTFLNHIVNNGAFISSDIVIDDSYLTDDSHVYIKKR